MAEQSVIALFRRAETLKTEVDGVGDNGGDKQREIFRLFGIIEWIFMEGDRVLERMEDQALARQIQDELEKAKEELKRTQIVNVALKPVNVKKELPTFPKYLDLPGPVVREKILSFLSSDDLLAVARAIPSEAQYFPQPLILLQMQAVFPILMLKDFLKPKDLNSLSGVDPYICDFIVKYYENVVWNVIEYPGPEPYVRLDDLIGFEGDYPVVSAVIGFVRKGEVDSRNQKQLGICGKRILDFTLDIEPEEGFQVMERIASYLELMPNLKNLLIVGCGSPSLEVARLMLPELPYLRSLDIQLGYSWGTAVQSMLLRKYGEKLELVRLYRLENLQVGFQIPGPDASVTVLKFSVFDDRSTPNENVFINLNIFANCPLKELHLEELTYTLFRPLLILLGRHWAGTLEILEITLKTEPTSYPENGWSENWMINLRFPKLRHLTTEYYPCFNYWSFLLLFPALEELTIYKTLRRCCEIPYTSCKNHYDREYCKGTQPIIQLQCNKDAVLSSNIWKLLPKLEKVTFGEGMYGRSRASPRSVTRKEFEFEFDLFQCY